MMSAPKLWNTCPQSVQLQTHSWPAAEYPASYAHVANNSAHYAPSPSASPIAAHLHYNAMAEKTTLYRRLLDDRTQSTPRRSFHLRARRVRASRMLLWDPWTCVYSFSSNLQQHIGVIFVFVQVILFTADGPQHVRLPIPRIAALPSCLWSRKILPLHAFCYGRQSKKPGFVKS